MNYCLVSCVWLVGACKYIIVCMYLDTGSLSPIFFQFLWVSQSFKFPVAIILLARRRIWGLPHTCVWHFIFFMLWCSLSIFQIVRPIPGKNWNEIVVLSCHVGPLLLLLTCTLPVLWPNCYVKHGCPANNPYCAHQTL